MAGKKQNLKTSAMVSYLWVFVHVGVNFIYAPLLISNLGKSEYGLYQIIASLLGYINVIESSVSAGVLRYYCASKGQDNDNESANVLAICRRIYRVLSAAVIVVFVIVAFFFRAFYASSFTQHELDEGTGMLGLLCLNLIVTMLNAVYLAAINGNERFVFVKLLAMLSQILQPVVIVMIIKHHPYAIVVTFVQVLANCVVAIIRYIYAKKELGIEVKLYKNDKDLARGILIFASSMLLSNIADQIFWKTDQIILGKIYDTATVAVYSVAAQIYSNYMYAGTTVASVFFPRVSQYYYQENGMTKISKLFTQVGRIAFMLCFMVLSGFIIFGHEFLYLWVGEDFVRAYSMAVIVMIPFTVDIIQNLGLTILQVMNKYSFRAKMYFVAAVLNIASTAVMAYLWEGYGAAVSTGISMFVTSGIILNVYYIKEIGLDILAFWKNILEVFIKLLPVFVLGYVVNSIILVPHSAISFVIKLLVYVLAYVIAAYLFAMDQYERGFVKVIMKKFSR